MSSHPNQVNEDAILHRLFVDYPITLGAADVPDCNLPLTDFLPPLTYQDVYAVARMMVDAVPSWDQVRVIVGTADRSGGAVVQAMSDITGIPMSLMNWYPMKSQGDVVVSSDSMGFSGRGMLLINGVSKGDRVVFADVCIRGGNTAIPIVDALVKNQVDVVSAVFAADFSDRDGPRRLTDKTGVKVSTVGTCVVSEEVHFLSAVHEGEDEKNQPKTPGTDRKKQGGGGGGGAHQEEQNQNQNNNNNNDKKKKKDLRDTIHEHVSLDKTRFKRNLLPARVSGLSFPFMGVPQTRLLEIQPRSTVEATFRRVMNMFVGCAIYHAEGSSYPYSNFSLTDFSPLLEAARVEDIADCMVLLSPTLRQFARRHAHTTMVNPTSTTSASCEEKKQEGGGGEGEGEGDENYMIVSESDRGGGPLAVAVAKRTGLRFTMANWTESANAKEAGTAQSSTNVGYSGQGRLYLNGIKKGMKCIFVDDMLSSSFTAQGVLKAIEAAGGVPTECVFASEKSTTKGRENMVKHGFGNLPLYSVCYFNSDSKVATIEAAVTPLGNETPIQKKEVSGDRRDRD